MTQTVASLIRPGDYLWRTPASDSVTVAAAVDDGATVEITGTGAGRPVRVWVPSAQTVHVTR